MIESNEQFSDKLWSNIVIINILIITIIFGIILHYFYNRVMIIISGISALFLLYLFYDAIPENADSNKINIISPSILCLISMFYPVNWDFLKKHTNLIGSRLTMKQKASIDLYVSDCKLRGIELNENDPGFSYLNYNYNPSWSEFISNFKYFFFEREIPASKISIY